MPRAKPLAPGELPPPKGRPTEYRQEFAEQAEKLCKIGATDADLAAFFEKSPTTIKNWRANHPAFHKACTRGKAVADATVEDSLFRMATGYTVEEEQLFVINGEVRREKTTKVIPANPVSAIFWLKNRRQDEWRDRQELTGKDGANLMPEVRVFLGRRPTSEEQGG